MLLDDGTTEKSRWPTTTLQAGDTLFWDKQTFTILVKRGEQNVLRWSDGDNKRSSFCQGLDAFCNLVLILTDGFNLGSRVEESDSGATATLLPGRQRMH